MLPALVVHFLFALLSFFSLIDFVELHHLHPTMAAPIHVPFRSVSLASSLDEEKKRPFHQVHEINLSEKQHKQPKCYKPFTTRTPFLSFIALFAVALLILCEALAHHYGDFQKAMKIPVPQIPGVAAPYKKRDLSKRSLAGTSKVRRDTEDVFKYR